MDDGLIPRGTVSEESSKSHLYANQYLSVIIVETIVKLTGRITLLVARNPITAVRTSAKWLREPEVLHAPQSSRHSKSEAGRLLTRSEIHASILLDPADRSRAQSYLVREFSFFDQEISRRPAESCSAQNVGETDDCFGRHAPGVKDPF